MVKTATVEEFQNSQHAEAESPAPFDLGAFTRKAVAERQGDDADRGDPFAKLDLTAEPGEAYGHLEARLRAWLEEHDIWALEPEIRRKADQLLADAEQRRPASEATYTVAADGTVTSFEAAPLPGMPAPPPAVEPSNGLKVPSDSIFDDGDDFAVSSALAQRARVLIDRHPEHLKHLDGMSVIYLWKRQGGKSKGRATFGKCSKPSGLLKHFSEAQFVIWLAADHCRAAGYRDREIEALLFHEMLHTGIAEVDENTGRGGGATLVPHELEVFRAEVEIYGLWAPDLKEVGPAFQQVSLFGISVEETAYFDAAGAEMEADIASGAHVPESEDAKPDPLVCSVCKLAVWEHELTAEEIARARQNPTVVLCERCGEDGVIDDGDDDTDIDL